MARTKQLPLRFGRLESKRLIFALLISLLIHLGVWGGYHLAKKYHLMDRLRTLLHIPAPVPPKKEPPKKEVQQQPSIYVDVDQADAEPPKKALYYASKNSQAANPDADRQMNQPKIDGQQKDVPKTQDVPKKTKLEPSPPQPPSPQTKPQPENQSSPLHLGDRELKKVDTNTPTEIVTPEQRPRTLKEAREQQHLPGRMMQQDGGVLRTKLVASLDAKSTTFGQYDGAIFAAIQQFWQDELDSHQYAQERTGHVTIKFILHFDGTVSNVQILDNEVGILLGSFCQEAIDQTAPYGKWPSDMLHEIGSTERTVTVTFIYY